VRAEPRPSDQVERRAGPRRRWGRPVVALLTALLGLVADGPGQASSHRFDIRSWDVRDGLPQSSVTAITQDPQGFLWLATFGGVARFDGVGFETWDLANAPGLPTNRVIALHQTASGGLWIGTQGGGLAYGRDGHFTAVSLGPDIDNAVVYGLGDAPDGDLWITTGRGVYTVALDDHDGASPTATATLLHAARFVAAVHWDAVGRLWVADLDGVTCVAGRCDGERPLRAPDGAPQSLHGRFVTTPDGTLWIAGAGGLWRCPGGDVSRGTLVIPTTPEAAAHFASLVHDPEHGRLWFSAGPQLWRIDGWADGLDAHPMAATLARAGLHDLGKLRSLHVDREASLWVGTDGGGLLQLHDLDVTHHAEDAGLVTGPTQLVAEDGAGALYVTQPCRGLFVRVGDAFERVDSPALPDCVDAMTVAPDGALWLGGAARVVRRDASGWTRAHTLTDASLGVTALHVDERGLWVGTGGGLRRVEGGRDVTTDAIRQLTGARVRCVVPDRRGGVWIGSDDGVAHVPAGPGVPVRLGVSDGIPRGVVRDILVDDDGAALVGTYGGGLAWVRDGGRAVVPVNGLIDNTVSRILRDGDDTLWLNGNAGISRVRLADLRAAPTSEAVLPVTLYGFEGNGGSQAAGWRGRDGTLWFPTINGLASIHPAALRSAAPAPVVTITGVTIDGRAYPKTGPIDVPAGRRDLSVRFTAPSFVRSRDLRYRYRLVGYSRDWSDLAADRVASWSNLPPGDFRFEVEARNTDGARSEIVALPLRMRAALTEQAWFYALVALALAGLIGLVWHLRLRILRAHERALERENAERRRAEAHARAEERRYRTLFDGTSEAVIVVAPDGRIHEGNHAATALLGLSAETLGDASLGAFAADGSRDRLLAALEHATTGTAAPPIEIDLTRADGQARRVRVVATPLLGLDEPRVLATAVDLTRERQLEEERVAMARRASEREHLESLGRLAGGVAHDVNNQLMAIGACAAFVREAGDGELADAGRDILDAVKRTGSLTQRLVVFARSQPSDPYVFDANEALASLHTMLSRLLGKGLTLAFERSDGPLRIELEPALFEHAIVNLVVNARDATPDGGTITIATGHRWFTPDEASGRGVEPGPFVWVRVADTGTGMSASTRARVFEPFFSTKPIGEGTGLGLYSVHSTVRDAGGSVDVDSEVGRGTALTLFFPARDGAATNVAAPPDATPATSENTRVLICDDHDLVRSATVRLLARGPFEVFPAADPEEALAIARELGERLDVLLTDLRMPVMNGLELAARLRERHRRLVVVLMSGHVGEALPDGELPDVVDAFVTKPFDGATLIAAIDEARARRVEGPFPGPSST